MDFRKRSDRVKRPISVIRRPPPTDPDNTKDSTTEETVVHTLHTLFHLDPLDGVPVKNPGLQRPTQKEEGR